MKKLLFLVSVVVFLFIQIYTKLTVYESLSVALFVFLLLVFVEDLGKKLVVLDVAVMITVLTCLILPIAGYHYFNSTNSLSRLWVTFMRVPSDRYYSYMLPATLAFYAGIKLPVFYRKSTFRNQEQYMINVKAYLKNQKWQGLIMVMIGVVASFVRTAVPASFAFVFFLFSYLMFVGIFYCLYSDLPLKRFILFGVFGLMLYRAIGGGMFGEMVFMGALTVILIALGYKISFIKKLAIMLIGLFSLLVLQAVKPAFRKQTWSGKNQDNKVSLFANMAAEQASNPANLLKDDKALLVIYSRFNEGRVISNVLRLVPARYPYANGESIALSLASTVVPRFLWPDKPEAGGAYNLKRFVGVTLKGWSENISPFGEAYGNFGETGGIIFVFFFGLGFNFLFHWLLKLAVNTPSLILWFPYMFVYAISIETDVLTMVNSFIKAAVFAYIIYKVFPLVFKKKV